jgi:hypothetical protein
MNNRTPGARETLDVSKRYGTPVRQGPGAAAKAIVNNRQNSLVDLVDLVDRVDKGGHFCRL